MTDYSAAALRPAARTGALSKTVTTTTRPAPVTGARTVAAGTAGSQTSEVQSTPQAVVLPAQTAGWARTAVSTPARTTAAPAAGRGTAVAAPAATTTRQLTGAPGAQPVRVWPVAGFIRPVTTPTRGAAVSIARGGDGTGTGSTTVPRPVQGLLWPRARATTTAAA